MCSSDLKMGQGLSCKDIVKSIREHISDNFDREDIEQVLTNSYAENGIVYLNEYLFEIGRASCRERV